MGKDSTISLLIADDCLPVRYGLRLLLRLEPDMQVIAEAADGTEALTLGLRLHPDVIVMDAHMPKMDGFTATKQLRALLADTPVIILSIEDDTATRARALAAGATCFLSKFETLTDLPDAIRAAARQHPQPTADAR
ncbi:MAG TPA: response regulator transcription factor [Ktedonobacterales bacterium]|nr:response regulator transcription factor [Ktedonobacterales bacterium]